MPKYRNGTWDGYISLLKGFKVFPTGLLPMIEDELEDYKVTLAGRDDIIYQPEEDVETIRTCLNEVILRDYQIDAVIQLLETQRGIAKMATNAGKTVVFAALIKLLGNANALVVVQTKDLLYQTSERLQSYLGREVGVIGDSHFSDCDICVATIQTLNSFYTRHGVNELRKRFANNKILVSDETHHIADNKTFDILMNIPGWHRYGMSGTPLNRGALNDLKLIACTGPVVTEISNAELIAMEFSAVPHIYFHDVPLEATYSHIRWDEHYETAYDQQIVRNMSRNNAIADIAEDAVRTGTVMIIVTRIEHGYLLLDALEQSAMFVNGQSEMEDRSRALDRLATGEHIIVIATNIFDEGVDVPAMDTLILACGGKSQLKLLQRIGRGMRKKEGNNILNIHDFIDGSNKHLLKHSEERLHVYKEEGFHAIVCAEGSTGACQTPSSNGVRKRGKVSVQKAVKSRKGQIQKV
jgi:superfamily II DNA or RNA helicase